MAKLVTAYVELIPSMAGSESAITSALVPAASRAGDEAGRETGRRFGGQFSGALAAGAIAAGVVGAFKGLYEVGAIFDDVSDTIRTGTGATGEALAGLEADARAVATTVPASFEAAGSTVADLNTRLGLSGETLQGVAAQYLEAGRILGEEVDINTTTAAFNAFGIEGERVSGAMDSLFQVSQATGVGMNELAAAAQAQAPALQALGFGYEDTIALVGGLDRAGLNSTAVMSSMSRGLVTLARDGEEPQAAFRRVTGEIEALIASGDQAGAIDLAAGIFGTRGATQFVGAVQSGDVALSDLMGGLGATSDTILGVGEETMDFAEAWTIVKNRGLEAIEPLSTAVFSGLGAALLWVADAMEGIPGLLAPLMPALSTIGAAFTGAFAGLGDSFGPLAGQFFELLTTVSPLGIVFQALAPVLPLIAGLLGQLAATVGGALGTALQLVMPVLTSLAGVLVGVLSQALTTILPIFVQLVGILGPILGAVLAAAMPLLSMLGGVITALVPVVMPLVSAVLSLLTPILGLIAPIMQLVGGLLPPLIGLFLAILEPVLGLAVGLIQFLMPGIMIVVGAVSTLIGWIVQAIQWFVDLVTGAGTAGADLIAIFEGIPGTIRDIFAGIGSWLVDSGRALIQGFIDGIGAMIGAVGDAVGGIMDFAAGFFPNSPAERGPFSGAGWRAIGQAGAAIEEEFASGFGNMGAIMDAALALPDVNGGSMTATYGPAAFGSDGLEATVSPDMIRELGDYIHSLMLSTGEAARVDSRTYTDGTLESEAVVRR